MSLLFLVFHHKVKMNAWEVICASWHEKLRSRTVRTRSTGKKNHDQINYFSQQNVERSVFHMF